MYKLAQMVTKTDAFKKYNENCYENKYNKNLHELLIDTYVN